MAQAMPVMTLQQVFPSQSHQLALLTTLTGKGPFIWTNKQQHAFDVMKAMTIRDYLLPYPDHNKPFQIYSNTSDYQLKAVIMQDLLALTLPNCSKTHKTITLQWKKTF
jgi:hypothetical protein